MARINLLPWRAERRKHREREFFMQLGAAMVAAILFVLAWTTWMDQRISNQNERNTYLHGEITQLDDNLRALDVKLGAEEVKELDEVSRPAWDYPWDFIGQREAW